jgi:hypothetical protein
MAAGVVAMVASCALLALLAVRIRRRIKKLEALQAEVAVRKLRKDEQERFVEVLMTERLPVLHATDIGTDIRSSVDFVDNVSDPEDSQVDEADTLEQAVTVEEAQAVTVEEAQAVKEQES